MYLKIFTTVFLIVNSKYLLLIDSLDGQTFNSKGVENHEDNNNKQTSKPKRYILYDVNFLEGFNLRRDVYLRTAIFVKKLSNENHSYDWILVLPPWGSLRHWKSVDAGLQRQIPWSLFFDVSSMKKYVQVMEMHEFINEYDIDNKKTSLDCVYILQNDENMFKTGKFEEKNVVYDCLLSSTLYEKESNGEISGKFWNYDNVTTKVLKCVTFHGKAYDLRDNLLPTVYRSVMFDHMEIALHDEYGTAEFWKARRSMRYNKELHEIANIFRLTYLNSSDDYDKTRLPLDWTLAKGQINAIGGPYLAVHLRRQDFIISRASPTIKTTASQIKSALQSLNLNILFIATDTDDKELNELKKELTEISIHRFEPPAYVKKKYKDGGVAIIDQIICAHAKFFIGTHESTFTFRIQEDREILGLSSESTFNEICKEVNKCPAKHSWKIVW